MILLFFHPLLSTIPHHHHHLPQSSTRNTRHEHMERETKYTSDQIKCRSVFSSEYRHHLNVTSVCTFSAALFPPYSNTHTHTHLINLELETLGLLVSTENDTEIVRTFQPVAVWDGNRLCILFFFF